LGHNLRTRWFWESAIQAPPARIGAVPCGPSSRAAVAGPPSPPNPATPVPATVLSVPLAHSRLTRCKFDDAIQAPPSKAMETVVGNGLENAAGHPSFHGAPMTVVMQSPCAATGPAPHHSATAATAAHQDRHAAAPPATRAMALPLRAGTTPRDGWMPVGPIAPTRPNHRPHPARPANSMSHIPSTPKQPATTPFSRRIAPKTGISIQTHWLGLCVEPVTDRTTRTQNRHVSL
jgi:hypothetical protein